MIVVQMLVLVTGMPIAACSPIISERIIAAENVNFRGYQNDLPEQALSEQERTERIRLLCRFSKLINKNKATQPRFHDDVILLLPYLRMRIKLLETLNSQERCMEKIESALRVTVKPHPIFFPQTMMRASVSLRLDGLARRMSGYHAKSKKLVEIIAEMSNEIDSLLDQQSVGQAESAMLRASACLPTRVGTNSHELTAQNAPKVNAITDNELVERFITPQSPQITIEGETYMVNTYVAKSIMALNYLTVKQKVALLLSCAYAIPDAQIAEIYRITYSGFVDHPKKALQKIAIKNSSLAAHLYTLRPNYERRSKNRRRS